MKRIQNGILGALDFVFGDGFFRQVINVLMDRLDGFDRALTLGSHGNLQHAGMTEVGANSATHAIGKAAFGANVVEQAGRKSAAEGLVENADGVVVRVVAGRAHGDHADVALVHVFLRDQVIAGLGGIVLKIILWETPVLWATIRRPREASIP